VTLRQAGPTNDGVAIEQLIAAAPGESVLPAGADMLALDENMRAFVATHVDRRAGAARRLRQLLDGLATSGLFSIDYDDRTYTAAETFHRRSGNCLSFTSMFVALAREARLEVAFREVDIPLDWSRSGESFVLNRHIDAMVRLGNGREQVVDFNIEDFRAAYDHRPVSDARAYAHLHSNLGVEAMQGGDESRAAAHFREAVGHDPHYAPAWVNLGVLLLRADRPASAEAAWRQALRIRPDEAVALSNLERLYRQAGDVAAADELRGRIERHRLRNPYFRYHLAQRAYASRDYPLAIAHLRYAVRRKKHEDRFYALLGMSYLRSGDGKAAQRWMARAAEVAADEDLQRRYHSKLELLRQAHQT
jgi:Flp pilus assembly protein TadD